MLIVGKKIRITGFIVSDHADMQPQFMSDMVGWIEAATLSIRKRFTKVWIRLWMHFWRCSVVTIRQDDRKTLSRNSQPAEMLPMRQLYPVDANSDLVLTAMA